VSNSLLYLGIKDVNPFSIYHSMRYKNLSLVIIIAIYIATRLVFLESDPPTWGLSNYAPGDEFYYNTNTFEILKNTKSFVSDRSYFVSDNPVPINLFEQTLTLTCLKISGNNYYGLRLPSVICGLLILIFFYELLNKRFGVKYALIGALFLIIDFGFLMANRIAEPTIFRMCGMMCMIYFLSRINISNLNTSKNLLIGFLSGLFFLFVYPANFFIVIAALLIVILLNGNENKIDKKKTITFLMVGIMDCYLFYWILFVYPGRYVMVLALFTSLALLLLIFRNLQTLRYIGVVISGTLIASVIFFAVLLIFFDPSQLYYLLAYRSRLGTAANNPLYGLINNIISIKSASYFQNNMLFLALFIFSFLFISYKNIKNYLKNEINNNDFLINIFLLAFFFQMVLLNDYPLRKLIILLPLVIYCAAYLFRGVFKNKVVFTIAFLIPLYSIVTSFNKSIKYVYSKPTYSYKNTMIKLKKYDHKIFVGGWSFCYSLYNELIPVTNYYSYCYNKNSMVKYSSLMKNAPKAINSLGSIYYDDKLCEEEMRKYGYIKKDMVMRSNDPMYPNMVLYVKNSQQQ
jgi:hypothetical protein